MILLDTGALLLVANGTPLAKPAVDAMMAVADSPGAICVSPISAWEIGALVARGRIALSLEPGAWFQAAVDAGLSLAPMTPEILVAASNLPACRLRDPADRILAATARAGRYRLITRDGPLLDYAAAGHVTATAC